MNILAMLKAMLTNGVNNPKSTAIGGSPLLLIAAYRQLCDSNPELQLPWHDCFWYVGFAFAAIGWICPDWRRRLHLDSEHTASPAAPAPATTEDVDRSVSTSPTGAAGDLSSKENA